MKIQTPKRTMIKNNKQKRAFKLFFLIYLHVVKICLNIIEKEYRFKYN